MVTQQNAATSEELSTNAVELSAQAEQLKEIISFFKTGAANSNLKTVREIKNTEQAIVETEPEIKKGVVIHLDQPDISDDDFERF
jgi:methyl-accepting chemotaxis protein